MHFLFEIEGNIAELLLDITDDFSFGGGGEWVATFHEDLDEVLGKIAAGKIQSEDGVRESETLVDGDSVGNTITGVENNTSSTTGGVEGEDCLDGNVEGGSVEGLEHDLGHLFTVSLGVQRSLSEKDGVLLRCDTKLVVESMMPDLLHVVPVGDNTVLDGVLEGQDTTFRLCLITAERDQTLVVALETARDLPDIGVFLAHSDHDTLMTRTTDD